MPARLGTTSDPRALVPGLPDAVLAAADELRRHAAGIEDSGRGLGNVDLGGWRGASSEAFQGQLASQPPKWFKAGDALTAAGDALTGYSDTLRWAQTQAREAIELWERGKTAADANLQQQAEELLDRAREQLREAGDSAAASMGGGAAPGESIIDRFLGWFSDASGTETFETEDGEVHTWSWWRRGPSFDWDLDGPGGTISSKDGFSLGKLTGEAYLVRGGTGRYPGDVFGYDLGNWAIGAEGAATGNVGPDGVGLHANVRAGGWAEGQGVVGFLGDTPIGAKLEGFVGGQAGADAEVGADGVQAKAGAFAGGRVGGELGNIEEIAGVQVKGSAEGWVGPGAEAEYGAYRDDDGKIHLGGKGGASPLIGGKLGGEVIVDPREFGDSVRDGIGRFIPGGEDRGGGNGPKDG